MDCRAHDVTDMQESVALQKDAQTRFIHLTSPGSLLGTQRTRLTRPSCRPTASLAWCVHSGSQRNKKGRTQWR